MAADIHSEVAEFMAANRDEAYQAFQSKLIPSIDPHTMVGVRTPALRSFAKQLAKNPQLDMFLNDLPHLTFEESQLHAFVVGGIKDYDGYVAALGRFLPFVDNWATCDQLPVGVFAKDAEATLEHVERWLASGRCYTIRFGIGVLMKLYLDDRFDERFLARVADARMPHKENDASKDDIYYVDMMRAWYFAEALAKQEAAALPYLEQCGSKALLDEWTRHKAIQKAIESRRIPDAMKAHLRSCR